MAIETLLNRGINVRDFHPLEERAPIGAKQKFEALRVELYDSELGWRGRDDDDARDTNDQLIGILVESLFDKERAKREYEKLKQTSHYHEDMNIWDIDNQRGGYYHSGSQLLGVYIEAMFDKDNAKLQYERLKQTTLYNNEHELWNIDTNEPGKLDRNIFSSDQLLGILVEGLFDKDNAERLYKNIKKTTLFNKKLGLYDVCMKRGAYSYHYTNNQLLGVIVESMFDKRKARKDYEELKKTAFYDSTGKWNNFVSADHAPDRGHETLNQLLGVWIEARLEEPEQNFIEQTQPIPEVRRF
jgi:hypothetical protein